MTPADQAFDRYRATGSPEELARVFDVCAPQLLLLANHVAGDGGVAEDLVQMTFLRAIEIADSFESGRPVQPWLIGILIREAKKHRRQAARKPDTDRMTEHGGEAIPAEVAEMKEFQDALGKALEELPPAYREVLTLRLIHGLTPTEIGHARGVSPQTIKTQIRRGTDRLRKILPPSFATALVAMAATGFALTSVRDVVLEAAAAASQGAAATIAATTVAETISTSAASLSKPAVVETVTAKTLIGSGFARTVTLLAGVGGSIALGLWAWDPFGGEPEVSLVEEREEIPDPSRSVASLRSSAGDAEKAEVKQPRTDESLVTFTGRVIGDSGMGLDGLPVEIVRLHPDSLVVPATGLPGFTEAPEFVAGAAITDDRGRFTIGGVKPSGMFLVVLAPGTDRVEWRLVDHTPEPRAIVDLGELRIERLKKLRGRIVDKLGFPVAGARLRHVGLPWTGGKSLGLVGAALEQMCADEFEPEGGMVVRWGKGTQVVTVPEWFRGIYHRILARTATTDENGRFEWVTTRSQPLRLTVFGQGIQRTRITVPVRGENRDVGSYKVARVGSIRVVVRDWNGDPLSGAEVMLGEFSLKAKCTATRNAGVTDEDGELHAAWNEKYRVTVAVRRGPGEPWHVTEGLSPLDRISIAMPRSFDVTLRVVERTGSAIGPLTERAVCRLLPGKFAPELSPGVLSMYQLGCVEPLQLGGRRTDEAPGVVKLREVPAGQWILIVSAAGHSSTAVALDVDGIEHVTAQLVPLESTVVSLDDPRFQRLTETPIFARASEELDRVHEFPVLIGQTDAEGVLTLERSRWRRHSVGTLSTELGACTVRAAAGVDRLAVALQPRGVIAGRVTERGQPPGTAWTVLARSVRRPHDPPPALAMTTVFAPVQPDGMFRLPPLEAGKWELRAMRMPGALTHPSLLLPVMMPEHTETPVQNVMLEPRAEETLTLEALPPEKEEKADEKVDVGPITLRGTVDFSPQPAGGLKVGVLQGGTWSWFGVAADGTFDTGIVAQGSVLMILVPAAADQSNLLGMPYEFLWLKSVQAVRGGVRIERRMLPVTFSLTTSKRIGAAWFPVTIEGYDKGGVRYRMVGRADKSGWFRMAMPKGTYSLRGEHAAHGWLAKFGVVVETPVALNYRLEPLLVAAGVASPSSMRVDLPKGSVVDFVRVGGRTKIERTVGFDRSNRFRIEGLLPGEYRVTVRPALRLATGVILPPARANISVPQGTIRIRSPGSTGIVLRRRK